MDEPLLWLGLVACAAGAACGLLPMPRRTRLLGLSVAVALGPVLVLTDNWDTERLTDLRDRPVLLAAGLVAALVGVVVLALIVRRRPLILAPALIAALPFRVPIDLGGAGEAANLLLPLYALIAAGLVAALIGEWRGSEWDAAESVAAEPPGLLRFVAPALGGFVLLYALQAGYADDLSSAVENVSFFLAPFAALLYLLSQARWDASTLRRIAIVLAAQGLLLALVASFQYGSGELFWNDKVIEGNEAHPYFRVNSLFWDPNILGRYLAVTLTALAALVAFGRKRRELLAASGLFVVLLATLVVCFSQSSMIALIAGVLVLVAARWGIAAGVGAGLISMALLGASLALIGGGGLTTESPGRSSLVDGGLEIGAGAPLAGEGSGSFADEFGQRFGGEEGIALESHTEPITVLAEQGAIGVVAYAALLVVTIGGLLSAAGLALRSRARGTPLACALLAVYAVMIVHSLGYAAFLTDPITWAVLAVAVGARLGRVGEGPIGTPPEPAKPVPIGASPPRPPHSAARQPAPPTG